MDLVKNAKCLAAVNYAERNRYFYVDRFWGVVLVEA